MLTWILGSLPLRSAAGVKQKRIQFEQIWSGLPLIPTFDRGPSAGVGGVSGRIYVPGIGAEEAGAGARHRLNWPALSLV